MVTPKIEGRDRSTGESKVVTTMPNFILATNSTLTLVSLPADAPALFPLEVAATLTGVHPEMLRYYSRAGLAPAVAGGFGNEQLFFDAEALEDVRRIEHYRRHLDVGRRALPLIRALRRAGDRLQVELRFLDGP